MQKLSVFNHVSLDGYFVDAKGAMTWAHRQDPEWNDFASANASGEARFLFGRVTYDLMASYWPTPMAIKNDPVVAARMNGSPKVVFSRSVKEAPWSNTELARGELVAEVEKMKRAPGPGIVILGSGSIVAQLTEAALIDEFQLVLNPVILGAGRTLFEGVSKRPKLKLISSHAFANGNVVLHYQPA